VRSQERVFFSDPGVIVCFILAHAALRAEAQLNDSPAPEDQP
jgi:hypothetical protein